MSFKTIIFAYNCKSRWLVILGSEDILILESIWLDKEIVYGLVDPCWKIQQMLVRYVLKHDCWS